MPCGIALDVNAIALHVEAAKTLDEALDALRSHE